VAPGAVTLAAPLLTNVNAFITATVTPGAITLAAPLVANASTLYAPTVAPGVATLAPARLDNASAYYSPTVTSGGTTLLPALYSNTSTFYGATLSPGAVTISFPNYVAVGYVAPGYVSFPAFNVNAFPAATVTPGVVTLAPARVDNASTFYAAALIQQQVVAPPRLDNAASFYAATVATTGVTLAPERLDNASTFFAPTVTPGPVTLQPPLAVNAAQFLAPTVELQTRTITRAQAQLLRRIHALHGLAAAPLVVGPTSRSAGDIAQTISQAGTTVTIATSAADDVYVADVGQMIEELAALHGLTAALTVTPTSRTVGALAQTLASVAGVTTVTRQ
jgi:adhesin HecA-like repeat protein